MSTYRRCEISETAAELLAEVRNELGDVLAEIVDRDQAIQNTLAGVTGSSAEPAVATFSAGVTLIEKTPGEMASPNRLSSKATTPSDPLPSLYEATRAGEAASQVPITFYTYLPDRQLNPLILPPTPIYEAGSVETLDKDGLRRLFGVKLRVDHNRLPSHNITTTSDLVDILSDSDDVTSLFDVVRINPDEIEVAPEELIIASMGSPSSANKVMDDLESTVVDAGFALNDVLATANVPGLIESETDAEEALHTAGSCLIGGTVLVPHPSNLMAVRKLYELLGRDIAKTETALEELAELSYRILQTTLVTTETVEMVCGAPTTITTLVETLFSTNKKRAGEHRSYVFWAHAPSDLSSVWGEIKRLGYAQAELEDMLAATQKSSIDWLDSPSTDHVTALIVEDVAILQKLYDYGLTRAEVVSLLDRGVRGINTEVTQEEISQEIEKASRANALAAVRALSLARVANLSDREDRVSQALSECGDSSGFLTVAVASIIEVLKFTDSALGRFKGGLGNALARAKNTADSVSAAVGDDGGLGCLMRAGARASVNTNSLLGLSTSVNALQGSTEMASGAVRRMLAKVKDRLCMARITVDTLLGRSTITAAGECSPELRVTLSDICTGADALIAELTELDGLVSTATQLANDLIRQTERVSAKARGVSLSLSFGTDLDLPGTIPSVTAPESLDGCGSPGVRKILQSIAKL